MANKTASCLVRLDEGGRFNPADWTQELRKLVAVGYVEKTGTRYTVTEEGAAFLKTLKKPVNALSGSVM